MVKQIACFFDYIYFRLAKLYFKTDGTGSIAPLVLITIIQFFVIIDFVSLINFVDWKDILTKERLGFAKWLYVIIYFIIIYLNRRRYKDRYDILDEKWGNESRKKRIVKGILILIFILSVIAFFGLLLNIRNA